MLGLRSFLVRHSFSGVGSESVVPGTGVEPARPYERRHLKAVRLPLRHPGTFY